VSAKVSETFHTHENHTAVADSMDENSDNPEKVSAG
jgi:hypothetical protein